MGNEIWNRFQYMLSPQFDIYERVSEVVRGEVADIGCGTGFGTQLLTRNADHVDGFEFDHMARCFANRAFANKNLHFWPINITDSSIPDNSNYDFVVMIDVIEHIVQDKKAIENCRKMLKPGGTFICSTPNKKSRYRKSENHVREYTPNEFYALLIDHFREVQIVDHKLETAKSEYENPIVARCQ